MIFYGHCPALLTSIYKKLCARPKKLATCEVVAAPAMLPSCKFWKDSERALSFVAYITTKEPNLQDPATRKKEIQEADQAKDLVIGALRRFAGNQRVDYGIRATAIFSNTTNSGVYYALTLREGSSSRTDDGYRQWRGVLKDIMCENGHQLKEFATVQWVRPFTLMLQRMLGLGDASSTEAQVTAAIKAEDVVELRAILPQAVALIDRGEVAVLPQLYEALRGNLVPAIQDCPHEWTVANFHQNVGRCRNGEPYHPPKFGVPGNSEDVPKHVPPFIYCKACKVVYCGQCHNQFCGQQESNKEVLRAVHEIHQSHNFVLTKNAECSKCGSVPAGVCPCGAQRCEKCCAPRDDMPNGFPKLVEYKQHPKWPDTPFFIVDQEKIKEDQKLEFMRFELGGDGADLATFAKTWMEVFKGKVKGKVSQKNAVLGLYAEYAEIGKEWRIEKNLPPEEKEQFQRVWDPDAPRLCRTCGKALPQGTQDFFHASCMKNKFCRKCGTKSQMNKHCWYICPTCPAPSGAEAPSPSAQDNRELAQSVRRGHELLRNLNNTWDFRAPQRESPVDSDTLHRLRTRTGAPPGVLRTVKPYLDDIIWDFAAMKDAISEPPTKKQRV